ncbi:hypothetical protein BD779DRAFT_1444716, partial [Infundibulicybe gibba]
FIRSADGLFGPITTLRSEHRVTKCIPWSVFELSDLDWATVLDTWTILEDSNRVLHHFSEDKCPSLYRALPAIEELQTAWEKKRNSTRFAKYSDGLDNALAKIKKYYTKFDDKPVYVLALVLHPYYSLDYIKMAWGGADEQAQEKAAGNRYAKNWQDKAHQILEKTVCYVL